MPTFKLGELFCRPGGLAFGAIHSKSEDEAFSVKHARQIGMAVPCELSKIVVTAILNSFAGIPYKSIPPNITF